MPSSTPNALKRRADKITTDFPTAPSAYGLNGPSAPVTVEKPIYASHTEILTTPMGADIETCQSDILCFSSDEPFDLVTTHSILSFIPQDQHVALFGNWRRLLRRGGRLIISQAVRPKYRGTAVRRFSAEEVEIFVQRALDDASRNGAPLQFPESELADLAQRFARNKFAYVVSELTSLKQGLQHGGFMIESLTDVNRALLGHKSASPHAETTMTNAHIVARAV